MIALNEPSPLLVVEVVSPSTASEDYRAKRTEYAVLNIPEYWIVDPLQSLVTVCTLRDGAYDKTLSQPCGRFLTNLITVGSWYRLSDKVSLLQRKAIRFHFCDNQFAPL